MAGQPDATKDKVTEQELSSLSCSETAKKTPARRPVKQRQPIFEILLSVSGALEKA